MVAMHGPVAFRQLAKDCCNAAGKKTDTRRAPSLASCAYIQNLTMFPFPTIAANENQYSNNIF